MRIQHTVVFSLRHEPDSADARRFLDDARKILSTIAAVEDFEIRRQMSPKSDLEWQFSMWFAGQGAYETYDAHPVHRAFVEQRWNVEVSDFQEYDFTAP